MVISLMEMKSLWTNFFLWRRGNKVVMDRARKTPKIVVRNWECGIVCSSEKMRFGNDSWDILRRFMVVDGAVRVIDGGRPWIIGDNLEDGL